MQILPSGLAEEILECWCDLTNQTYDLFGETCQLIYPIEFQENSAGNTGGAVPEINTINSRRRRMPSEYDLGGTSFVGTNRKETVRVKIYWDAQEWKKVYGFTSVPDNQVMILSKIEDSEDINSCIELLFENFKFTRVSKVVPYGFRKDKYGSSIWRYDS